MSMNSALPRISIVTPSYNQGQFLEATIRSVLDQGYPNLEYMVMDGGSTDESVDIIRRYSGQLAYWASAPDGGQSAAIGQGFKQSTGGILGWLNSDDMLLPGSLEHVAQTFRDHPKIGFLCGGLVDIDEHGHVTWCHWPVAPTLERLLVVGFYVKQPECFFTRSAYTRAGGIDPDFEFAMDYDLFLRILRTGRARATTRLLACSRSHAATKTATLQTVRQAEVTRIKARCDGSGLTRSQERRVYLRWRMSMYLQRGPQLFRLWLKHGHLRPWKYRQMLPVELI